MMSIALMTDLSDHLEFQHSKCTMCLLLDAEQTVQSSIKMIEHWDEI